MERVRAEWARRTVAEYRSAAAAQELGLWLLQLGASPDLIAGAMRVAREELGHAELALEVLTAAGGAPAPVVRETLRLAPAETLERSVLHATAELFCVGETTAVPLFRAMRVGAGEGIVGRALTRILREEAGHRAFGWTALTWLLDGPCAADRAWLGAQLPAMRAALVDAYGRGEGEVTDTEAAWGLLSGEGYRQAMGQAERRWIAPRFAALGLTWS